MIAALASASCIMGAMIAVLALITLKTWILPQGGDKTIIVSILPDTGKNNEKEEPEQETRPTAQRAAPLADTPKLLVTSSAHAEWNWTDEIPDQMVAPDPELAELLLVCREFDPGTEWKEQVKKTAVHKRQNAKTKAAAASSGGENGPVSHLARYKHTPLPPYPRAARLDRLEGVVILLIHVDAEGLPQHVSVSESSGVPLLDEVSVAWVSKNWTFFPATGNDGYVACQIKAPIRFQLN